MAEKYRVEGESARSGYGRYRTALDAMLRDAERGRFEGMFVWALDRLSREGPLAALQLVDRLGCAGGQVMGFREPWTEAGRELRDLLSAITTWIARMESQRRSERTQAGLEPPGPRGSGSAGRPGPRAVASVAAPGASTARPASKAAEGWCEGPLLLCSPGARS